MAWKFNPETGEYEDDTTTSTGGEPVAPPIPVPTGAGNDPQVTRGSLPNPAPLSDSGGQLHTSPVYTPPPAPAVGANGSVSVPRPSVDPSVVYTDQQGNAYDPPSLVAAWNTPAFRNDPMNARVGDILAQYGYGGPSAAPAAAQAATAGGGGATAPQGASAAPAAIPAGTTSSPFNDQIRQILMAELAKAGQPVDPNSPDIAATMSAASDAGSRASDAERTALAERLYAQGGGGLHSDELTREVQQSGEKQAGTLSALRAQLLTTKYSEKMQQLQQDLALAMQSGDAESARQVQTAIANLSASMQKYGIDTSASVSRSGQGINLAEFMAQLNQNAALAGLNG